MARPWDALYQGRVDTSPNPDAGPVLQQIGQAGESIARSRAQGLAALGAGIGGGISAVASQIMEREARDNDPATQLRMAMLRRSEANSKVLGAIENVTPAEHYGGPVDPATGQRRVPTPPIEGTAQYLFDRHTQTPGSFEGLTPLAKARVQAVVGTMQTTPVPLWKGDNPETRAAMAEADPAVVAEARGSAIRPEALSEALEARFRQAIASDPVVTHALEEKWNETEPIRQAEARGNVLLAKALNASIGDRPTAKALDRIGSLSDSTMIPVNGVPVPLHVALALKPSMSPQEVRQLQGYVERKVPVAMVDDDGGILPDTKKGTWMATLADDQKLVVQAMGDAPWERQIEAAHDYSMGLEALRGLTGGGGRFSLSKDGKKGAGDRGSKIQQGFAQLVKDYGTAPVAVRLSNYLWKTSLPDPLAAAGKSNDAGALSARFATWTRELQADPTIALGQVKPSDAMSLAALRSASWESQLSNATTETPGSLSALADVNPAALSQAWEKLAKAQQTNPAVAGIREMLASRGITGPELESQTGNVYAAFEALRPLTESTWARSDPSGREWAQLSPAEKAEALKALAEGLIGDVKAAPAPEAPADGSGLLPEADRPSALLGADARALGIRDGVLTDGILGQKAIVAASRVVSASKKNGQPSAGIPDFAAVKRDAWIPAQDVYRDMIGQRGFKDISHYRQILASEPWPEPIGGILRETINGHPLYEHIHSVLAGGKTGDFANAYDSVMVTLRRSAERQKLSLSDLQEELRKTARARSDDPLASALSVFVDEALSTTKIGRDDRQLSAMAMTARDFMPEASMARARDLYMMERSGLRTDPLDPMLQSVDDVASEALPPTGGLAKKALAWNPITGPAVQIGDMLDRTGADNEQRARAKANADMQAAIEQGKPYRVPNIDRGGWATISPGDPEYGMTNVALDDATAWHQWAKGKSRQRDAEPSSPFSSTGFWRGTR